jgi:NAD-dependent dihydropyrimidine dehydrogenase PreA subunit
MKRKIIEINEHLCNGCGLCVSACHEGAIQMVDGKAKLISDEYCDGLGDCLPACPTDAIKIIEREAAAYDEELVNEAIKKREEMQKEAKQIVSFTNEPPFQTVGPIQGKLTTSGQVEGLSSSKLQQWPVQLRLINPAAQFLKGANILIAADCSAYAYGNFHEDFIKDRVTIIACPKLDNQEENKARITQILKRNDVKSITVVRMEVPCCGGLTSIVKECIEAAESVADYNEVTLSTEGRIL